MILIYKFILYYILKIIRLFAGNHDDPLSCNNSDWLSAKVDGPIAASRLLCRAAAAGNLPGMLKAIALGADPNFRNSDDAGKTPLIYSLMKVCDKSSFFVQSIF